MARRLTMLAVLLTLGGCVVQPSRRCPPGYHAEQVRTDGVSYEFCWSRTE